ncbi:MAG: DNA polymerase IV [Nitrospirae bacterium]|nr:DNA polymerase IV [Nitrospirota bacterium]
MSRIILCIDMDAFFASVEQQSNPKLRGKPVAVIGSGNRTVITTRSYEARKFGVKTGMNIYEAKKLCPHIIFVTGNNEKYTHTCTEMQKIYLKYTPDVEIYSIDESFLDVTTTHHLFGGPEAIGYAIKKQIKEKFGINCTAGIGPNILMAKLASDISKPDGLRWIKPEDINNVLEDLPLKELWGIGSGLSEKLNALGIKTCGQLGRTPASLLRNKFGIIGEHLKAMGMGLYNRPLYVHEQEPKSIGHSMTFPKDLAERKEIEAEILKLSEMVGRRARHYKFKGRKVTLIVRYSDFKTFSRQTTLFNYTNHTHEIYKNAVSILDSISLTDKVRLLGVSLSALIREKDQMSLFKEISKQKELLKAMDSINDRYGDFKIIWGSYLKQCEPSRVISPAWKPSGIRHINVKR